MAIRCQKDYEICSYIYNPEDGDPDAGIQPGTTLEDIPSDWICPKCKSENQNKANKEGNNG